MGVEHGKVYHFLVKDAEGKLSDIIITTTSSFLILYNIIIGSIENG